MKTFVYKLSGKNKGRVGWIKGDLASREKAGITKALVRFPQISFPNDFLFASIKTLVEATPLQVIMEGLDETDVGEVVKS